MIPFGTSVHWSAIVSLCSKDCKLQDRHSDVQAVACLPEVSSPWIVIHLLGNLQRVAKEEGEMTKVRVLHLLEQPNCECGPSCGWGHGCHYSNIGADCNARGTLEYMA
eukprot:1158010-Pelagomonas_calceolata.AAC.9